MIYRYIECSPYHVHLKLSNWPTRRENFGERERDREGGRDEAK